MGQEKWDEKSGGEKGGARKVARKVGREKWDEKSGVREKWGEKSGTRKVG